MNIVQLFCILGVQGYFRGLLAAHLGQSEEPSNWIDSLIKHIEDKTNAHKITLITNSKKNESTTISPIVENLFIKIGRKFPTVRLNIEDSNEFKKTLDKSKRRNKELLNLSTGFFIFVHYSRAGFDDNPSPKETVDTMLNISSSKSGSQYLLVIVRDSEFSSKSQEPILEYGWNRKLFDLTIIEFVETTKSENVLSTDCDDVQPFVHQLNKFEKRYSITKWTPKVAWFPNKVLDMCGHPMKVLVVHRPPFSVATFDKFAKPVDVGGANIDLLKIISKELNFTIEYQPHVMTYKELRDDNSPRGINKLMKSGKLDIVAYLSPHYDLSLNDRGSRTTTIRLDGLCTLMPILPKADIPISLGFFQAYFVYISIIVVFWIFARIVRFSKQFWYPFNITRVMLGASVAREPQKWSERTLHGSLLLVSAIFSSNIYSALTSISLDTHAQMEFNSMSDLANSGLTPMINIYLYNKTFANNDVALEKLKKKVVIINGSPLPNCSEAAATEKDTACLLLRDEISMAIKNSTRYGPPRLKITKPCFWFDATGFLLGSRSPYRSQINNIIVRLSDTGVLAKCYQEKVQRVWHNPDDDGTESGLNQRKNTKSLLRQLHVILIVGYTVSILGFIGEIFVYHLLRCRCLKKEKLRGLLRRWRKSRLRRTVDIVRNAIDKNR